MPISIFSGLRRSEIIQEKDNRRFGKLKIFGFIVIFASVVMYSTKSVLLRNSDFSENLLSHEERAKYSLENLTNFTNSLASKIESVNDTFNFNESTSQPERMEFLESTRKEFGAHEDDQHWNIVSKRDLN